MRLGVFFSATLVMRYRLVLTMGVRTPMSGRFTMVFATDVVFMDRSNQVFHAWKTNIFSKHNKNPSSLKALL